VNPAQRPRDGQKIRFTYRFPHGDEQKEGIYRITLLGPGGLVYALRGASKLCEWPSRIVDWEPLENSPAAPVEGEHVLDINVRLRGFGHLEQVRREGLSFLGQALHDAFGERAEMFDGLTGARIVFDPLAADGNHPGHENVLEEDAGIEPWARYAIDSLPGDRFAIRVNSQGLRRDEVEDFVAGVLGFLEIHPEALSED
jgi:hypothetical protein